MEINSENPEPNLIKDFRYISFNIKILHIQIKKYCHVVIFNFKATAKKKYHQKVF